MRGVARLVVETADTALSLGSGDMPVLGTPRLVALLEKAARSAVDGDLPLTSATVGVVMHVEHVAPSPVGAMVIATAQVREQTQRRIDFDIEARDENGTMIAKATHRRVVVDRASFIEKVGRPAARERAQATEPSR